MYSKLLNNPYFVSVMQTSLQEGTTDVTLSLKGHEQGLLAGMTNFVMVLEDIDFKEKNISNLEAKGQFIEELKDMLLNKENMSLFGTRQFMSAKPENITSYTYSVNAGHLFGIFEKGISHLKEKIETIMEKEMLIEEIKNPNARLNGFKL